MRSERKAKDEWENPFSFLHTILNTPTTGRSTVHRTFDAPQFCVLNSVRNLPAGSTLLVLASSPCNQWSRAKVQSQFRHIGFVSYRARECRQ
jgi:hypothetical protein